MTRFPSSWILAALAPLALAAAPATPARAQVIDLAFMPPAVEPQPLCAGGADDALAEQDTDAALLRFLRRDIRALSAEDADRWFDFIADLIAWQAELDPAFSDAERRLALVGLHVDAGRLDALRASNLVESLRADAAALDGAESMGLAELFLNGAGVQPDPGFAHELIREAAFGGNPDALLAIARMAAAGEPMPGWDAPQDLTLTLAFGGILGQLDPEVCGHAERIAQAYLDGEVVARNPEVALAWLRFAADLGGPGAAWRVVEAHLAAEGGARDGAEMLRYLRIAVGQGFVPSGAEVAALSEASPDEAALRAILGPDVPDASGVAPGRRPISAILRLEANLDAAEPDATGPYHDYLVALTRLETAPGWVFTRLAQDVLERDGRWAGEAEAMGHLEEAARRGDPEGMQLLAGMLIRTRHDPARLGRAVDLLTEAVEAHGFAPAMADLDGLFRCQAPDAPRLAEADHWARAHRAAQAEPVDLGIDDAVSLSPFEDPWSIARIQAQALDGQPQALGRMLERVQLDPAASDEARRLWAARAEASDKALELFAIFEFALAETPAARDAALELFRRVYLNNGVTSALDLSVALVDDDARDPEVAAEVSRLLRSAAARGEGASIRLLARLESRLGRAGSPTEADIFAEFAPAIEARGDFLALMFAIPHVDATRARDYVDRAVSLMACSTKDADELGEAEAILGEADLSTQWRRIALVLEGGNVLSKLQLRDEQVAAFGTGPVPTALDALERELAEGGGEGARRGLFALTADPGLPTFDPAAAAGHLLDALEGGDEAWVLASYRQAAPEVRAAAEARFDLRGLLQRSASRGDPGAALELGLLLRTAATGPADLAASREWLQVAADGGTVPAMAELGRMMATGLGGPMDREGALRWLDGAARGGDPEAADLARLLRLSPQP